MLGFTVINQLWETYEFKNYDQGSQAFFWLFEACPKHPNKKEKKFDWVTFTYNAHQQKGRDTLYVCGTVNHFAPIGGPGGCDFVNDIVGVLNGFYAHSSALIIMMMGVIG
jgi:hypothetical protein